MNDVDELMETYNEELSQVAHAPEVVDSVKEQAKLADALSQLKWAQSQYRESTNREIESLKKSLKGCQLDNIRLNSKIRELRGAIYSMSEIAIGLVNNDYLLPLKKIRNALKPKNEVFYK